MEQVYISSISLSHFRGILQEQYHLTHASAIIGENGSGKTHILESIHVASGGQLHYFHAPSDENYQLSLLIPEEFGMKMYQLTRVSGKDEYRIQGTKVSSIKYRSELPYRTVFLSPFDMNLLYFAPSLRRDYIDSILSRTYAQFPQVRREYERIMRQRNALLKKIREGEAKKDDLDFWDKKFSEVASQYREYRMSYVDFVQDHFHIIQNFLPKYTLSFRYSSKIFSKSPLDEILAYLSLNRDRDILSGHTHIGPHLDDFSFVIGSGSTYDSPLGNIDEDTNECFDAAMLLSRGETKVLLLALKQIEVLFLKKHLNLPIVLLFDDVFAELDSLHAERVIELFDVDQVIVTTQRPLPAGEKWDDFSCIKLKLR